MALSTQPYKGTRDFFPEDMRFRNWMFARLSQVVESFGYGEYDGPLLESFELYAAKSGEELVGKQLYAFEDRGERRLAIRPEMTPTLARMVASRFQELPRPIRLYSIANFMRYERPQRGRLREFYQLNVDVLGGEKTLADGEILQVAWELVSAFGGASHAVIRLNHRRLMDDFFQGELGLDPTKAGALSRLLDARDKMEAEKYRSGLAELGLTAAAQERLDRLYAPDLQHKRETVQGTFRESLEWVRTLLPQESHGWTELMALADLLEKRKFQGRVLFDPGIMRGLDYYTGMVFEVFDASPENRRAMFGGGRYDSLFGLFGKPPLSGVGFGMGDVTLQNFLETHGLIPDLPGNVDVYVGIPSSEYDAAAAEVSHLLRGAGNKVVTALGYASFGAQLKEASKLGAGFAALLGETEWAERKVLLKNLRTGEQKTLSLETLAQAWTPTSFELAAIRT